LLKNLIDRPVQFLFDNGDRLTGIKGRDPVLELGKSFDIFRGNDIRPGGKGLTNFDKSRAQIE
jgi:hypothetical protein